MDKGLTVLVAGESESEDLRRREELLLAYRYLGWWGIVDFIAASWHVVSSVCCAVCGTWVGLNIRDAAGSSIIRGTVDAPDGHVF